MTFFPFNHTGFQIIKIFPIKITGFTTLSSILYPGFLLTGFALIIVTLFIIPFIKKWLTTRREMEIEKRISEHTAQLQKELELLRLRESDARRNSVLQAIAIAAISHDIKSPVKFIIQSAREMDRLIKQNQMDLASKAGEVIAYTGDRIHHLIEDMSEFLKATVSGEYIKMEEVNLAGLVIDKISTFSEIISVHGGHIATEIQSQDMVFTNPRLLGILIHNLIDNAIKAKTSNQISIYTKEIDNMLHLVIADTGPGMPDNIMAFLNAADIEQNTNNVSDHTSNGLGTILIKEICRLLHLGLRADNFSGTQVHIIFSPGKYSRWER